MKKLVLALLTLATICIATPENNPVLQPSPWKGYGVDWDYRSLRIGLGNADSLLEDGWALIDSLDVKYAVIDSTYITNLGTDTLTTIYFYADTANISVATLDSIDATIGTIDSLISNGVNATNIIGQLLYSSDSLYVNGNAFINNILYVDSISGHSPISILSPAAFDSVTTFNDSVYIAGPATFDDTLRANTVVVDSNLVISYAQSPIYKFNNGSIIRNPSVGLAQFWNNAGKGYLSFDGNTFTIRQDSSLAAGANNVYLTFKEEDGAAHQIYWEDTGGYFYTGETFRGANLWTITYLYLGAGGVGVATILTEPAGNYWAGLATVNNSYAGVLLDPNTAGQDTVQVGVTGDSDIFHSECSENRFDSWQTITDYALTAGALVTESRDARPISMQWTGQITEADFTAAAVQEDIVIISGFPAKYKITSILIDITQVFDDGGGSISAASMSFGTAASPAGYLGLTDCYTAITQIGDAAGEVAYTAVQGGIVPSWTATTDLSVRLRVTGGNVVDFTTGIADIYITYLAIE